MCFPNVSRPFYNTFIQQETDLKNVHKPRQKYRKLRPHIKFMYVSFSTANKHEKERERELTCVIRYAYDILVFASATLICSLLILRANITSPPDFPIVSARTANVFECVYALAWHSKKKPRDAQTKGKLLEMAADLSSLDGTHIRTIYHLSTTKRRRRLEK